MTIDLRDLPMIGIALALFGMLGLGAVVASEVRHQAEAQERVSHTLAVLLTIQGIEARMAEAESELRGYSIARDPVFLETFDEDLAGARDGFAQALALTADNPAQQVRLEDLEPALERRLELLSQRHQALIAGTPPEIPAEAGGLTERIRRGLTAMRQAEIALLESRRHTAQERTRKLMGWCRAGASASVAVGLLALWWIARERRFRHTAEGELVEKHGIVNGVFEGTSDAVFAKDLDGRYLMINSAGARVLGRSVDQVIGRRDDELFEDGQSIIERDVEVLRVGASQTFEATSTANGITRTWLSTRAPYRDATGRIIGLVGISRDITDRKIQEQARLREMTLLLELAEMFQACRSTADAYEVISRMGVRLFPKISGGVSLVHPSRNLVELRTRWGELPLVTGDGLFGPDDCWALRRGRPHLASGEYGMACRHGCGPGAACCMPLLAQGEVLGVLHLRCEGELDPLLQRRAAFVAEQIGMAVANLELRETLRNQSIRDPLTGLYNRRFTEDTLRRELLRAARQKGTLAVLVLDLDHFKRINDTFGHDAGDRVLREVGAVLTASTRGDDVASRIGGEELVVILPGIGEEGAKRKAEHLRARIAGLEILAGEARIGPVTASIGVALYPTHGDTVEGLLKAGDAALYAAKRGGRDRVVYAGPPPPAEADAVG